MTMPQKKTEQTMLNGIDVADFGPIPETLSREPDKAVSSFHTLTRWTGGMRTRSEIVSLELGGERIDRRHVIEADEPVEICGTDSAPNPQELILSAIGSCLAATWVIHATAMGIELRSLQVDLRGTLDIRGLLELADVPMGFPEVTFRVTVDADASDEQCRALHDQAMATSPNFYHLTKAIPAQAELVIAG